jgi:hypothetical protein
MQHLRASQLCNFTFVIFSGTITCDRPPPSYGLESGSKHMTLNVKTSTKTYAFDGPFDSESDLEEKSGVYVISTKGDTGMHIVIDVGESGNVWDRVSNHDRAGEWKKNQRDGLYMSAYYCVESSRMTLETELRNQYNPACGRR